MNGDTVFWLVFGFTLAGFFAGIIIGYGSAKGGAL